MAGKPRKTRKTATPRKRGKNVRAFAKMKCPVKGCTHWLSEREGTVPGVKRHVRASHAEAFDKISWPPTYDEPTGKAIASALRKGSGSSVNQSKLESLSVAELRDRAKRKGIKTTGLRKPELVSALIG